MDVRQPAVAGLFYPAGAGELAALVDSLLDAADAAGASADGAGAAGASADGGAGEPVAEAYIVPHAGYRYSGPTAARVYARLRRHAAEVERVVLIGPAHYVRLAGCAAPATAAWLTPLGSVPVDQAEVAGLAEAGYASLDDLPHEREHSLEVQLPFLQRILPAGVPVVPLAVGACRPDDVRIALLAAARPGTLVLCSTDLSHYLRLDAAQRQDARTAQAILDLEPDRIGVRDACGCYALRGLLAWARHRGLRPGLLHLCTSAETTGDPSRVVGYGAFALTSSE